MALYWTTDDYQSQLLLSNSPDIPDYTGWQEWNTNSYLDYPSTISEIHPYDREYSGDATYLPDNCTNLFRGLTDLYEVSSDIFGHLCEFDHALITKDFSYMFQGCTSLQKVEMPWDSMFQWTVQNFKHMFDGCTSLTTFEMFPTGGSFTSCTGTDFTGMFNGCTSLRSVDFSRIESFTGQSITTTQMFNGCSSLTGIYVPSGMSWVSKIGVDTNMFASCALLPNWDGTTGKSKAFEGSGGYFSIKPAAGLTIYRKEYGTWMPGTLYYKQYGTWMPVEAMWKKEYGMWTPVGK